MMAQIHPAIFDTRSYDHVLANGYVAKTLIVETDIEMPSKQSLADTNANFMDLLQYCSDYLSNNNDNYSVLEIRPYYLSTDFFRNPN